MKQNPKHNIITTLGSNYGSLFWDKFLLYGQQEHNYQYYIISKTEYVYNQIVKHRKNGVQYQFAGTLDRFGEEYGRIHKDKDELLSKLRTFEQQSNTLIMDIIQSDRVYGLGCYFGGRFRPRNPISNIMNYWDTLCLIGSYIDYYEEILNKIQPELLLSEGAGSLPVTILHILCRMRNIPIRKLTFSRYENYYYWSYDEFEMIPWFPQYFGDYCHNNSSEIKIIKGYKHHHEVVSKLKTNLVPILLNSIRWLFNRMLENIMIIIFQVESSYRTFTFQTVWISFFREWYMSRKLNKIIQNQKIHYENEQYVFYPLHTEPESALNTLSKEFNNQVALIDLTAKALPVGVILVVKEHVFGLSTRPPGFYEWLNELPNVCIAPSYVSGAELAQNSLFTVTITGTAGMEAAVSGVPVIVFSKNVLFASMKHVYHVTDVIDLRETINQLVNHSQPRKEWLQEGQRYLQALQSISMDMGDDYIQRGDISQPNIEKLWNELLKSLRTPFPVFLAQNG